VVKIVPQENGWHGSRHDQTIDHWPGQQLKSLHGPANEAGDKQLNAIPIQIRNTNSGCLISPKTTLIRLLSLILIIVCALITTILEHTDTRLAWSSALILNFRSKNEIQLKLLISYVQLRLWEPQLTAFIL
jgi:hypothetical protein